MTRHSLLPSPSLPCGPRSPRPPSAGQTADPPSPPGCCPGPSPSARDACWVCGRTRAGGGLKDKPKVLRGGAPVTRAPAPGERLQPRRRGPAAPSPPAAGPHLLLGRRLRGCKPCPQAGPPKPWGFLEGRRGSREKDVTWAGLWAVPAARTKPAASPPTAAPAGFALGSSIRPPPPRGPGPLPAPRRRGHPPLRPGRASRAPSRVPLPPFSSLLHPSPPPPVQPQSGLHPGCRLQPGRVEDRGNEEGLSRCCQLPASSPQRPPLRHTSVPLQPGPQPKGLSRGPCLAAQEGRTPLNLPHCSPQGRGRVGGSEGAAPRAPGASSPPGERWTQVRDAAPEARRAAALPLRRHWRRRRGM
ncbi:unnamed protein product, partial [Rangifer tarandus platyrhynchus]